eukprot:TRINITY_DN43108_c0_g1_i1.p1 TRINITY_DN43108_c0_g1~~TRINITY_DN43108_c0_g1_i1.p1  ORF type:complete len:349 (+),score=79.54 TRINITY_DN43108_c0_g1_i1:28-1047(+)
MTAASDLDNVLSVMNSFEAQDSSMKMFSLGLPSALEGPDAERHAYQVEFIRLLRDALQRFRDQTAHELETTRQHIHRARVEHEELMRKEKCAVGTEEAVRAEVDAKMGEIAGSTRLLEQFEQAFNEAKKVETGVLSYRAELQHLRDAAAAVKDSELCMLVGENWVSGDQCEDSIAGVGQLLVRLNVEQVLVAAMPAVFRVKPSERGSFDKVVEQGVIDAIVRKINSVDQELADGAAELDHISSAALGAWAILEVAKEEVLNAKTELTRIHVALMESNVKRADAEKDVRAQEQRTSLLLSQLTLQEEDLRRLEEACQALDRLEAGRPGGKEGAVVVEVTG